MMKKDEAIELLARSIEAGDLEYYKQTGSYAYVAAYEDGELEIVFNELSAENKRPDIGFEIIAYAKYNAWKGVWEIGTVDEYGYETVVETINEK